MNEKPHPISLIDVVFTKVHVEAVSGHKSTSDKPDLENIVENNLHVAKRENTGSPFHAIMQTKINSAGSTEYPYLIDIECHGIFEVTDELNAEEAVRGVTITAHSVLYGAIRETIAWLTGRQPHGPLVMGLSILASRPKVIKSD